MAPHVSGSRGRSGTDGEIQHFTTIGRGQVDWDAAGVEDGLSFAYTTVSDVSPPPATEWEIYEIHAFAKASVRNPTSEENTAKPAAVFALSYDSTMFGSNEETSISGQTGLEGGISGANGHETDDWILAEATTQFHPSAGVFFDITNGDANQGTLQEFDYFWSPPDGSSISLQDTERLHLHVGTHYPTEVADTQGDASVHMRGGLTLYYRPRVE